jgi:hypothetical protein
MAAPSAAPITRQWPADVLKFAAQHQVEVYLDPLLAAIRELYPTAQSVVVLLEEDPELRDDWHIVFEVGVPAADFSGHVIAKRFWHRYLFHLCPAPVVCIFRLTLLPIAP